MDPKLQRAAASDPPEPEAAAAAPPAAAERPAGRKRRRGNESQPARADDEAPGVTRALFPQRFRQLCVFGVLLVCVFFAIDVTYPWPAEVIFGPRQFFGLRTLWVAGYMMLLATSYIHELSFRAQVVRDVLLTALGSVCVGVLCAHTGRLASPHYGSLIILMLARFVLLPGAFLRVAPVSLFMLFTFAGFACLWPSPFPRPGFFGVHGVLTLAVIIGAMVPGLLGAIAADRLTLGLATARLMGRYRLIRRLGQGGMGEVHLAYHASLRRPCAVKILKEGIADATAMARFEREAEAASRLRHPNTIAVFDFGRTAAGQPYYVMEFLDGSDLAQLVRREGLLPPDRAVYLLEQIAGSLAEAHSLDMIHRDVKPGNLFITTMGGAGDFVKVLDFGLVKGVDLGPDLTRPDAFMGTPRYMAPEALCGQPVDARADVYALGTVAYFMLCGEPPFSSGDAYLDVYRQIHDPPPPISSRRDPSLPAPSRELLEIIERCLQKERARRPATAAEVLTALEKTPEHGRWRAPLVSASARSRAVLAELAELAHSADELAPTDPAARGSGEHVAVMAELRAGSRQPEAAGAGADDAEEATGPQQ